MSVLLLRRELVALMTEAPENEEPEESSAEILGGRKIHDRRFSHKFPALRRTQDEVLAPWLRSERSKAERGLRCSRGGKIFTYLKSVFCPHRIFDISNCWEGNSLRWLVVEPTRLLCPSHESQLLWKWEVRRSGKRKAGSKEVEVKKSQSCVFSHCSSRQQCSIL